MASVQTSAIPATSGAATPAPKASAPAQNGGDSKFAAMLTEAAPQTPAANTAKSGAKNNAAAKKSDSAAGDTSTDQKTDAATSSKTDTDKDAGKDTRLAANEPPTLSQLAAAAMAKNEDSKTDDDKTGDDETGDDKVDGDKDADAKSSGPATDDASQNAAAQAAQLQAQPPQIPPPAQQQASADAAAQAQQLLAAGTPGTQTNAPPAPNSGNISGANSVNTGSAKAARTPSQPASQPASGADDRDQTDAAAAPGQTPLSPVQAALKSAAHGDGKSQTANADAVKTDVSQPDQPQILAAPALPPQPPSANLASANLGGVSASVAGAVNPSANGGNAAANFGVAVNAHIAPQDAAPNVNSLAVEIAARSQSGSKEFQIRLDPPELGHVEVRLSIDANGKAEAHMTADQPQALDLLQKNSPSLTSALRDAGLDVSQSGLNFSLKGQDRQENSNGGAQAQTSSRALTATKTIDAAQSVGAYLSSAGNARLDIHV